MTTVAIIGGGLAGRSLIYALAKGRKTFSRLVLFDSDQFAPTCSLRSTAIVAPRGVTTGHSDLGDKIVKGFQTFSRHVENDRPQGVHPITQFTSAVTKLDQFQKRYPQGEYVTTADPLSFKQEIYVATENAYMVEPQVYLDWLLDKAKIPFENQNEFITGINPGTHGIELKTQSGAELLFDKVILCGGSSNRFWKGLNLAAPVQQSSAVQGGFLAFENTELGPESFSLTLEGDNLIYHAHTRKLLMGSTTDKVFHVMPKTAELRDIYQRLSDRLALKLPLFSQGKIVVGLREKSTKREPYLLEQNNLYWLGGFYKNGYSLGMHLAAELAQRL